MAMQRQQVQTESVVETSQQTPITRRGLSVVLPAYNEEAVIGQTVTRCLRVLAALAPDFEVIVVDDGSRDRTGVIADALARAHPTHVRVVHNRPNRGYGGALMAGFDAARKELAFFMDSDGQFDIADLAKLLVLREQQGPTGDTPAPDAPRVVLGYRQHRNDPPIRLLNAWGWNRLVRLLFGVRVRDVDCAFKLFDTELMRLCAIHAEGAMWNTELLVKLRTLGIPFVEVAVGHYPRQHGSATGANLRVIVHAFRELLRLRGKLTVWRAALPPGTLPGPSSRR